MATGIVVTQTECLPSSHIKADKTSSILFSDGWMLFYEIWFIGVVDADAL